MPKKCNNVLDSKISFELSFFRSDYRFMKMLLAAVLIFAVVARQAQAQGNILTPGDPIIGGQMIGGVFVQATQGTPVGNANMFPANGRPALAIDGGAEPRYRNFGEVMTGFVVTPSFTGGNNSGTVVTRIRFATAVDSPERDPLTFTLEGTNGDPLTGIYTLIASGSTGLDVDPGRGNFGPPVTFTSVGAAHSYRVIFPTVRNSSTADSMQIGEVAIIGIAAPEPTAFTLLGLSAIGLLGSRRRR